MQEMNLQLLLIFANLNLSLNSGMGLVLRMLDGRRSGHIIPRQRPWMTAEKVLKAQDSLREALSKDFLNKLKLSNAVICDSWSCLECMKEKKNYRKIQNVHGSAFKLSQ